MLFANFRDDAPTSPLNCMCDPCVNYTMRNANLRLTEYKRCAVTFDKYLISFYSIS